MVSDVFSFEKLLFAFEIVGVREISILFLTWAVVLAVIAWKFKNIQFFRKSHIAYLCFCGAFCIVFSVKSIVSNWENNRDILLQIVPAVSVSLQSEGHERISLATKADDPTYLKMIDLQKNILKIYPGLSDIYTLRKFEGKNRFIVDSETDYDRDGEFSGTRESRTAIGEEYSNPVLDPVIEDAYQGRIGFVKKPYVDKWGFWVSSMSPLYNVNGEIDAVIGIDFPADVLISKISEDYYIVLLIFTLVYLLGIYIMVSQKLIRTKDANVIAKLKANLELANQVEAQKLQLISSAKMAALGEMAAGIAHEINNPLAIIKGSANISLKRIQDLEGPKEELIKKIEMILKTTDRLKKIVSGLQKFSRSGDKDPFEPSSVRKIVDDALAICEEKLKAQEVQVRMTNLEDLVFSCRETEICQVIGNLINNSFDAIKDLPEKWIEIESEVVSEKEFVLRVMDSGRGIPVEIAEKIMQPFFTTKEVGKGTGLGLSISKGILESHGGYFSYDSTRKNTTFVLGFRTLIQRAGSSKVAS